MSSLVHIYGNVETGRGPKGTHDLSMPHMTSFARVVISVMESASKYFVGTMIGLVLVDKVN